MDKLESFDSSDLMEFITPPKIKVLGVGGAGNNILKRLYNRRITGVQTIALNTDAIHLNNEDGLNLAKKLNSKGFTATLDLLGEEVNNRKETNKIREAYCDLLDGIANYGIDCNVSLKLTLPSPT